MLHDFPAAVGTKLYCLVMEAHVSTTCPGLHSIAGRPEFESVTYWLQVQCRNHSSTEPHTTIWLVESNKNSTVIIIITIKNCNCYRLDAICDGCTLVSAAGSTECETSAVSVWVSEWVSECEWVSESAWVSEWLSVWVSVWVTVSECECVREWMRGWVSEWGSEWVGDWVSECVRGWVSEYVCEWVHAWMSEWVCVSEWVSACVSEC